MRTRRCFHWLSVCLTILALSGAGLASESYAQGGTAETATTATTDEGGGTCDGCLEAIEAQRDGQGDSSANRDFITGISPHDRDAAEPVRAPSAAVFSVAMLVIGTVVFFIRRWFAMPT